jgi:hypothetical protein
MNDYPESPVTIIYNVGQLRYCPICGEETTIEHREYETYVECPEHDQLLINNA